MAKRIILLAGPTASGKSKLAIEIAKKIKGEIINTDSMQVYKDLSILSSRPSKADLKKVIKRLVDFKPTVICLEISPENNSHITETYEKYKHDQTNRLNWSEEVNILGLEVGRLGGTKRIYGIDGHTGFHYMRLAELANRKESDSLFLNEANDKSKKLYDLSLLEQFTKMNTKKFKKETFNLYNQLATTDTINYESTKIVATFYERNLKIYTNLLNIPLTNNDRVLIVMGATHTSYLDVFLENNPKYKLEEATEYTNYTVKN